MLNKKTKYFILFLIVFLSIQIAGQNKFQFQIIVNKNNPIKSIDTETAKRIFLKKITKWENEEKIYPVDLKETSKTREVFTEEIHNKKVSAIKAYWQKQIFTGRGVPPPEKSSERELLEYVEKNVGAIGYISKGMSLKKYDVKTIDIKK